jgi:hypothetical protein
MPVFRLSLALCLGLVAGCSSASDASGENAQQETVTSGLKSLLASVPAGTKWADLDPAIKSSLEAHAGARLARHHDRWGAASLAQIEPSLLDAPTSEMKQNIDRFVQKRFAGQVPSGYSATGQIANADLLRALKKHYLLAFAINREQMANNPAFGLPPVDWDGVTKLDGIALPDRKTDDELRQYAQDTLQAMRGVPDSALTPTEAAIKKKSILLLRAEAAGTRESGYGFDLNHEVQYIPYVVHFSSLAYSDKGGKLYPNDDDFLEDVNAAWFAELAPVDAGTLNTTLNLNYGLSAGAIPQIKVRIGDPATNEIAKDYVLLGQWWLERLKALGDAIHTCTIYSGDQRATGWDGFTAYSQLDNLPGTGFATVATQLSNFEAGMLHRYQTDIGPAALSSVFPDDSVITAAQRQHVIASLATETQIGGLGAKIAAAIQAAGNPDAANQFTQALGRVKRIGGYTDASAITQADKDAINGMFEQVKAFVIRHYSGAPGNIERLVAPQTVNITADNNSISDTTGKITMGLGPVRGLEEWYGTMIHELHHSINFLSGNRPEGVYMEGEATVVELTLIKPLLTEAMADHAADVPLYLLDNGMKEARMISATAATVGLFTRETCDVDAKKFATQIANQWGLVGNPADVVALRANNGTQYLQYLVGADQFTDLQDTLSGRAGRPLDPYVFLKCGIFAPQDDATTVAALRACLGQ